MSEATTILQYSKKQHKTNASASRSCTSANDCRAIKLSAHTYQDERARVGCMDASLALAVFVYPRDASRLEDEQRSGARRQSLEVAHR